MLLLIEKNENDLIEKKLDFNRETTYFSASGP